MLKQVLNDVRNPGPEFRGAPFWAWNAKLEPEELRRQIRFMKEMGLGGFFMHSRVGLNTPYLKKEWFDCVRACIDEAEKLGMNPWLYDEDRWPSGAGGGYVTKNPEFRQRCLQLEVLDAVPEKPEPALATFAGELRGPMLSRPRKFNPGSDKLKKGEKLLVFRVRTAECSSWYNGQTYLDTMSPKAVGKFIEVTHEAYRREISSKFGHPVQGIFTDEPNFIHWFAKDKTAWTDALPEKFREKYGYDILDHLPELFYLADDEEFSMARLNYRDLCTELFVQAFARLIGEWCGRNNLMMTGHVLCEDDLVSQTAIVGSPMRFYQFMQAPGIDLLTEHWGIFNTAKQCTSAAHQFGRPRRLSETYGCTGWDFPFAGHKALGDWQFAMGINFRCQHLAWYSMAAEAKRDYPASISYQSPWYREFDTVEHYFGRLGAALSEGEEQRDLLVIHPGESTWGFYAGSTDDEGKNPVYAEERLALTRLTNPILAANIDFDFGDEEIMSRLGSVKEGKLFVNKAGYRAVLVPQLRTIRSATLRLLSDFAAKGGKVFFYGTAPARLDGGKSAKPAEAFKKFRHIREEDFSDEVSPYARRVSICDAAGHEIAPALYILKRAEDHQTLFICNYSTPFLDRQMEYGMVRDRRLEFPVVRVSAAADPGQSVFELDLMTGKITKVESRYEAGALRFETSLPALGSRLFFLTSENIANAVPPVRTELEGRTLALPETGWKITKDDFNVLVLDRAAYSADGEPESAEKYFIKIDDELRKKLGAEPRGGLMVQPWLSVEKSPERTLALTLDYSFQVSQIPSEPCWLALERPDLYEIAVNGVPLEKKDGGFWCDICLRRLALAPAMLKLGRNTITLKCSYQQYLPGLESMFLLGNFGVIGTTLTAPVEMLSIGDWCDQGLPHYSGNLTFRTSVVLEKKERRPCMLRIPDWRGVSLAVSVNGRPRIMIPWPPYSADISADLKDGENVIEITVFGHRRNAFGPFYLDTKWPAWTGPFQFKEEKMTEKQLVPCGLLKAPVLEF